MDTAEQTIDALARELVLARRAGRTLESEAWRAIVGDSQQAYRTQDEVARTLEWFTTDAPKHWKSGGPARSAVLTHAPLPPDGVRASPADFGDMHFNAAGIEAEIALRLAVTVTPERAAALTAKDAASLIDAMAVSIEVVDSRWHEGAAAPALLRLADMQSHGALALGDWTPYVARDWAAQRCEVGIGTQQRVVRTGTHPLGDPAWLLPAWLRHATRHGDSVPAGSVVTTGSWVGILPVARGDTVCVEFAQIGSARARL